MKEINWDKLSKREEAIHEEGYKEGFHAGTWDAVEHLFYGEMLCDSSLIATVCDEITNMRAIKQLKK